MKKFFGFIGVLLNLLFVAALLLAGSSVFINPNMFELPSLLSLFFLPLVLINIMYVLYWMLRLKWYFVLSFIAILLVGKNITNTFPINKAQSTLTMPKERIKVLSYNVKMFDFYKKNKTIYKNDILAYIVQADADVVCLQEFGYSSKANHLTKEDILSVLSKKYKYHHIEIASNQLFGGKNSYGIATFSTHKIEKSQLIPTTSSMNLSMYSDVKIGEKIYRVFNCHLVSNELTHNDKKEVSGIMDDMSSEKITSTVTKLSKKLGFAFKKRADQAETIKKELEKSTIPTILCGDFNEPPVSYSYRCLRGKMNDAFVETSTGLGVTYNEGIFRFRIDYIFYSKDFQAVKYQTDKVKYSDHYPIHCLLSSEP